MDAVFPGPYLSYHGDPILSDVQKAYDLVMDVVNEEGPFDGVIGFSQGATLAATVIATEAIRNPGQDIFRVAVFLLSTTMPFDFGAGKLTISYDGINPLKATHYNTSGQNVQSKECDWLTDVRTAGVFEELEARRKWYSDKCPDARTAQSVDVLLRYHPTTTTQRIQIPTTHVIALKDEHVEHARLLVRFCEEKLEKVVVYDGGHQLPRDRATVEKVAEAIHWAVENIIF